MSIQIYTTILIIVSIILTLYGLLSLWQILKGWADPKILSDSEMPKTLLGEKTFFSIIIPARHEKSVIADTLAQLFKQNYSQEKYEILVAMAADDTETIEEVNKVITENRVKNAKSVIFHDGPINKPHGLNVALKEAKGDYIVIFDAEDHVHQDLLKLINSVIIKGGRKIIQTGVSLLNWQSNWFSLHAVLEYYFWFKSRLPWYASKKVVTLAGVGVFIPRELLSQTNGWDEKCLTEDAKLGIDYSVKGYPLKILNDEKYSIQEEVPSKLSTFICQRTRWIQGFLQVVVDGGWQKFSFSSQVYFLSLFTFPLMQIAFHLWFVFSILMVKKLPINLAMLSFFPAILFLFHNIIQISGLIEMLNNRKQTHLIPTALFLYIFSYIPYQLLINISAVRAIIRHLSGNFIWEKTTHFNSHRKSPHLADLGALSYE